MGPHTRGHRTDLIDTFDALFRHILPGKYLAELGTRLEAISTEGGGLSTAMVKKSWTQVAPVLLDARVSLETGLGQAFDKLASAIESEAAHQTQAA